MPGKDKIRHPRVITAITAPFILLGYLTFLFTASLWKDVGRVAVDMTGLAVNWILIINIIGAACVLYALRTAVRAFSGRPLRRFHFPLAVFLALFWLGFAFILFSQASDAILVAMYLHYGALFGPWILLAVWIGFAGNMVMKNVRERRPSRRRRRLAVILVSGLAVIALAVVVGYDESGRETAKGEDFSDIIVFDATEDERYRTFRIPGLAVTSSGTMLAYVEAREGFSDWDDIDLLLRRSFDGGETWEDPQVLFDGGESTAHNAVMIPVSDTRTVHLLYNTDYARCWYRISRDDGATWSYPAEITDVLEGFRPEYPWNVVGFGPGHGLELSGGRLLVPLWLSPGGGGDGHHPQHTSTIYSDDGGRTWEIGEMAAVLGDPNYGEPVAVELSDGRVMMNMRNEDDSIGRAYRAVSISPDGISGWSEPVLDEQLPDPISFGSIHRMDDGTLLFSNAWTPAVYDWRMSVFDYRGRRQPMGIRISRDDGSTWSESRIYRQSEGGYSDVNFRDGRIHILYEQGWNQRNMYRTKYVRLVSFPPEWVSKH